LPSFDAPFADAWSIFQDELPAYVPPERINVADYAAEHRWLDNRGGGFVGRWDHNQAPFLIEPMETLNSRDFLTEVVVGPARSGKTAIGQNWMLQSVGTDPADFLVYMQTDDAIESYVKREINPMIDMHDVMRDRLGRLPVDRSLHFKRFRGMWVEFLAASYSNMISKSAPRIIVDEPDAYAESLGDALELANVRRQSYGRESMLLATSHPDRADGLDPKMWRAGIMKAYADSDRRIRYWPCPVCNDFSAPNPMGARVMRLDYPADAPLEEIEEKARLICPSCGAALEDHQRRLMDRDGLWVGLGETIASDGTVTGEKVRRDTAGFWITGLMSPFIIGGIGSLARNLVRAQRHAETTGEDGGLRSFTVKSLGLPYDPPRRIGSIDAATLLERAEELLVLGRVPAGVRFIDAFIDVQGNRFELLRRGWGEYGESWVIDYRQLGGAPAISPQDWDAAIEAAFEPIPLADGSGRRMRVRAVAYDSGGVPGVTNQAYDAWRRWKSRGATRNYGTLYGLETWSLLPAKGASGVNAGRLSVVYPEGGRKDRTASAGGLVPLMIYAPNAYKDDLAGQLETVDGRWSVHMPAALKSPAPPHAWFEGLTAEQRRPNGTWEKKPTGPRNEPIDLMVGTHALAELHGLRHIRWDSPPAWAAPWDRNAMVEGNTPSAAAQPPQGRVEPRLTTTPVAAPPPGRIPGAIVTRAASAPVSRFQRMA
jgi:phage terminase large subunit GpA-like protein